MLQRCCSKLSLDNVVDLPLDEDPFADLVVDPSVVPKHHGRRRTRRREAGDCYGLSLDLVVSLLSAVAW